MGCLQLQFQKNEFKNRYPQCYKQIVLFTRLESKDTRLNTLLTRACRPIINNYCQVNYLIKIFQNFLFKSVLGRG